MNTLRSLVSSLAVVGFLTACGGGSDNIQPAGSTSTTTTVTAGDASRYAGTWSACFSNGASTSQRETIVITPTGATTAAFTDSQTNYSAAGCAGSAGTPTINTGSVAFTGTTKIVGTSTVDKGTVTQGTNVKKQIFLVTATTLNTGKEVGDGGTVDADGYPNSLDSGGLTKQ